MRCTEFVSKLDDYLDGDLASQDAGVLEQHAVGCASCEVLLEDRQMLRRALMDVEVTEPSADFFERALAVATQSQTAQRRSWFARTSTALTTVAAALLLAGVALQTSLFTPASDIPEVTITLHEVTPVNLQFASVADLKDAQISLQLPDGVELAGLTGRKQLSWRTDLQEGDNLLQLPLLGYMASTDRLIAELKHPQGSKTFELQITVN